MAEKRGRTLGANCLTCQLRQCNEWRVLNEEETRLLARHRKSREYRAGESIFSVGEPSHGIYCVVSGTVAIRKSDVDGNVIPIRLSYPGDTLGYRGLLLDANRRYSAEALSASRICFIEKPVVKALLDRNPALGKQFLQRIGSDLSDAHDHLVRNATLSNRGKFIHLLLALMNHHGCTAADGSRFMELPLSRRDLASMIGARHETLSRIIGRLEEDGLARFSGRTVHLTRPHSLLQETERPSLLEHARTQSAHPDCRRQSA